MTLPEHAGTDVKELMGMVSARDDFDEAAIETRTGGIIGAFVDYLGELKLLAE